MKVNRIDTLNVEDIKTYRVITDEDVFPFYIRDTKKQWSRKIHERYVPLAILKDPTEPLLEQAIEIYEKLDEETMSKKKEATCIYNSNRHMYEVVLPYCTWRADLNIVFPHHVYMASNGHINCEKCKAYEPAPKSPPV